MFESRIAFKGQLFLHSLIFYFILFVCFTQVHGYTYSLPTYLPTYLPIHVTIRIPSPNPLVLISFVCLTQVCGYTYSLPTYILIHVTIRKPSPNPLCISTQFKPSGKEFIQTTNLWLFDGPFPTKCVHSGFIMDFLWKLVDFNGWEWCMVES